MPPQPEQESVEAQDEAGSVETAVEREKPTESAEPAAEPRAEPRAEPVAEPAFDEQSLWRTDKVEKFPEGFPQAAALVNADPSFAIFRCFSRGRTRVILQLQAELTMLERELDERDRRVNANPYAKYTLYQSKLPQDHDWPQEAKDLLAKHDRCLSRFKEKLREYDNEITRYNELRKMPLPSQHARKNVGRWFYQTKPLVDIQNDHMTYIEDLVTLGKPEEDSWMEGGIANFLERQPLWFFKRFFVSAVQRKKARDNAFGLSDQVHFHCSKRLKAVVDICTVAMASVFALLPFYVFSWFDPYLIPVILLSSLLSSRLVSISTTADRQYLFVMAMAQSSIIAFGALVVQVLSARVMPLLAPGQSEIFLKDLITRMLDWRLVVNL